MVFCTGDGVLRELPLLLFEDGPAILGLTLLSDRAKTSLSVLAAPQ
jgi:hypothetical protein